MQVGINLLYIRERWKGGTAVYAELLLRAMSRIDTTNKYVLFTPRNFMIPPSKLGPNFEQHQAPISARPQAIRYAWEQIILPAQAQVLDIDVLHSLGYVGPLYTPCKHVITIHDVNFLSNHVEMGKLRRLGLRTFVPASAKCADEVIAVSGFSREKIIDKLGIDSSKVSVVHEAPALSTRTEPSSEVDEGNAYANSDRRPCRPYLLAFGSPHPHKNIQLLFRAFHRLIEEYPHTLVVTGDVEGTPAHDYLLENLDLLARVKLPGFVNRERIATLMQGAELFVFPSLYEGFGLPVLEAQVSGTPLVASKAAALPEIAGDGALFFDPRSENSLVAVLRRSLSDSKLRERLRQEGMRNVDRFSWEKAARKTLEIYGAIHLADPG